MNIWKASTLALAIGLGVVTGGSLITPSHADSQPHMVAALDHLKLARADLNKAFPDKGGHRVKAIDLTKKAIEEVGAGIAYDDKH